jgi:hypothetical protein
MHLDQAAGEVDEERCIQHEQSSSDQTVRSGSGEKRIRSGRDSAQNGCSNERLPERMLSEQECHCQRGDRMPPQNPQTDAIP